MASVLAADAEKMLKTAEAEGQAKVGLGDSGAVLEGGLQAPWRSGCVSQYAHLFYISSAKAVPYIWP